MDRILIIHQFRQPEISDNKFAIMHEDILGLEIAMDHFQSMHSL